MEVRIRNIDEAESITVGEVPPDTDISKVMANGTFYVDGVDMEIQTWQYVLNHEEGEFYAEILLSK